MRYGWARTGEEWAGRNSCRPGMQALKEVWLLIKKLKSEASRVGPAKSLWLTNSTTWTRSSRAIGENDKQRSQSAGESRGANLQQNVRRACRISREDPSVVCEGRVPWTRAMCVRRVVRWPGDGKRRVAGRKRAKKIEPAEAIPKILHRFWYPGGGHILYRVCNSESLKTRSDQIFEIFDPKIVTPVNFYQRDPAGKDGQPYVRLAPGPDLSRRRRVAT